MQASLFSMEHINLASSSSFSRCLASAAANSGSSCAALAALASLSVPSNETLGAAAAVAVPVAAVVSGTPLGISETVSSAGALIGSVLGAGVMGVELPLVLRFFSIHEMGGPLLALFTPLVPMERLLDVGETAEVGDFKPDFEGVTGVIGVTPLATLTLSRID
jgi:hypothetical protein